MNKQPQFIVVNTGKKKRAVMPTLSSTSSNQLSEEQDNWPPSLKEYVAHAFENCLPNNKKKLEKQLKMIIQQAEKTNMLNVIDWNERDLPLACIDIKNPNSSQLFHKKAATTIVSKMGNIELTPAEEKKRQLRAMRFQATKMGSPTPMDIDNELTPSMNDVIVGTSNALEKPYFRLTSAVDPTIVRPLKVLKKAFKMLRRKWKEESNYSYICEQFKSMRQDLTVQRIQNEFTVRVYETHARIALEKGDIGEYNQCQTQLKYLYKKDIPGCEDEFLAYRILYLIFSQNQSEINAMLEEMCDIGLNNHADCIQHALLVRSCLAKGDYHKFFRLYEDAPNMSGYLMDQFVERIRIDALIVMCKAYKMGLPFSFISKELSFDSIKLLFKFFKEHGIHIQNKNILDTKSALPILLAQSKNYNKIDIKGQI
ncbi:SAC3/GANP/Nin1/mts3/eIF-3 p25 family-domain-containing protein [Cokeromyces recurvatus]|uniref:SAC3/GANP/Nin1/mts3/eIF-3 p25 family-domain-containing protein n=1 Tax=Cokeromyces recurvatus TaxID=90255 RepID=UPI00221F3502|nr:SAC3/GANP/Nin1/mts3/eIF-3 p25 family-domain-containing protein [Cokeromyces recurvatus]XP_051380181.1 SAC3/GANP/Nin1/mts3/eIF-3 p25 family-domain-containing protein [Cokeromyces recurvatus]KAI7899090.1 SAC3/GANP/Nin1/mts3/eIF-3 p25 family-domain-containing protein [Cokeromyces recurvatus]KAI7900196.1 SAC3/GANP/Nin1/mts3/eIF-3 p25 family-domain-containing protein [Cokeromyces recurvatus]